MTWGDFECNQYTRWVTACIAGAALALGFVALFNETITRAVNGPPLVVSSIEIVKGRGKPGEFIRLAIKSIRTRACPAMIYGFWTKDGQPFERKALIGGFTPVGRKPVRYMLNVPIPQNAPAGLVEYRYLVASYCDDGTWNIDSGDIAKLAVTVE